MQGFLATPDYEKLWLLKDAGPSTSAAKDAAFAQDDNS